MPKGLSHDLLTPWAPWVTEVAQSWRRRSVVHEAMLRLLLIERSMMHEVRLRWMLKLIERSMIHEVRLRWKLVGEMETR